MTLKIIISVQAVALVFISKVLKFLNRVYLRLIGFQHYCDFPFDVNRPLPPNSLEVLREVAETLRHYGVSYFVRDGTLLGLVRGGDLIAHDSDIDIGILGLSNYSSVRRAFMLKGWSIGQLVRWKGDCYHLTFYTDNDCVVDFTFFRRIQDGLYSFAEIDNYFYYPARLIEPVANLEVMQTQVSTPHKSIEVLELTYGPGWIVPKNKKKPWREEEYGIALPVQGSLSKTFREIMKAGL